MALGWIALFLKPFIQRTMDAQDKKRPGGIRQRLESELLERTRTSSLSNYLLGKYAWDTMSVQQVQQIASLAMEDLQQTESLAKFPDLEKLSTLGTGGVHVNNMSRDIGKYIDSIGSLPPTSAVEIPTNQGDAKTGIMSPHEILVFFSRIIQMHSKNFSCQVEKLNVKNFGGNAPVHHAYTVSQL